MILKWGDMWDIFDYTDYFCITTNASVNTDGQLVMGKGIAKEAAERFSYLPEEFGKALVHMGKVGKRYGLYLQERRAFSRIVAFQVKYKWQQKADPLLIAYSTGQLAWLAEREPSKRFDLNFPGIGNGGLSQAEVYAIIKDLPDNVFVWKKVQS